MHSVKEISNPLCKKMKSNDKFWQYGQVNYYERKDIQWSNVSFFVNKWQTLSTFIDSGIRSALWYFIGFKSFFMENVSLGAILNEKSEEINGTGKMCRIDTIWYYINNLKSCHGENYYFKLLVTVEYLALITPHSNGCIEKVYAIDNNNKPLFLSFSIFGQFSSQILCSYFFRPNLIKFV